jgi:glutamyl-tRNA synthetase
VEPDRTLIEGSGELLVAAAEALAAAEPFSAAEIETALRLLAEERGLKPREAFQPIRVAITGSRVSPGLFESIELLGRDESIARLSAR